MGAQRSTPAESAYVVRGDVPPDTIARSLQALLPTRQRPIASRRFTVLDTAGRGRDGTRPPQNSIEVEECGSLLEVLDDQGKTVARLRIASGRARLPRSVDGWRPLPTVITLTSLRGYEDAYRQLVPVIESRPGLESCADGFRGVMLRHVGQLEMPVLSTPLQNLEPTVRADVGARRIQQALFDSLVANEPGVRANLDPEFLHDFRVAVRRTRALLRQIKDVFPAEAVERFSTEFSWLGQLTGGPRDLDVLVLALRERPVAVPDTDMEALMSLLTDVQRQEHQTLVAALDGDRYRRLLSEWPAFLDPSTATDSEPRHAKRPLADVVARRAWRLSRRIARAADRFDDQTTPEQLHEVRIDAKKLRYLIDVTPGFYPADDLACILGALKNLQRVLGDFNDSYVQQQRLLEYGRACTAGASGEGAVLAIGRLAEESAQHRERLRDKVIKALARFRAPETRAACRRAFEPQHPKER